MKFVLKYYNIASNYVRNRVCQLYHDTHSNQSNVDINAHNHNVIFYRYIALPYVTLSSDYHTVTSG